ncbi:MAG: CHAT domain-containing protein [Cyanobacteria bacterium SBLK]|nr:CHAT domain-containing protein [Cyanobacteria bacterium SBLK]
MKNSRSSIQKILLLLLGLCLYSPLAQASPIQANDNTIVSKNGNLFNISGGDFSGDGSNLFHSFQEFGLDAGQIANFLSSPNIQNILGRVTGGNPSLINGLIQVIGGTSNLFLMNPAGIIFGENASLNILGDFTATTATGIGFGNDWFNAFGKNHYQNLIGNPNQFAFDLMQHGEIINHGNLAVRTGQSLTFLGGSIINNGTLSAPDGQISVTSIPGENLVRISYENSLLSLEIIPPRDRELRLVDLPRLLTGSEGTTTISGTLSTEGDRGGEINILGDRIDLLNATINASGQLGGGNIFIGGDYQGGERLYTASYTTIDANSSIYADAIASGDGGRAIVWADNFTEFYGEITVKGGTIAGDGGFTEVSGKQELLFNGWVDASATDGLAGTLLLDPKDIIIGSITNFAGITGDTYDAANTDNQFSSFLSLQTSHIDLQADRHIVVNTSSPLDLTNAASVTFTADYDSDGIGGFFATNDILINGILTISATKIETQALTSNSSIKLTATNGNIETQNLTTQGSSISLIGNGNFKPQEIITHGGNVSIQLAGDLLSNHNIDTTRGGTNAGDIFIDSGGDIQANALRTSAHDLGQNGGSIWIDSGNDISLNFIETYASNTAGSVAIVADRNIDITGYSNLTGGLQGGNLTIRSFSGNIGQQNANVSTGSVGVNNGGNISLSADNGNVATGNLIASSANGRGGNLRLEARDILTGEITSTGLQGGGSILLNASDRNILTNSIQGSEISLTSPNAIAINGIVTGENNLTFDTGILTITGIDPNGNSILTYPGAKISITSGTDFTIGQLSPNIGGTAGAIGWISGGVLSAGNFNRDTVLGNFSIAIRNPSPTFISLPPPAPIFVTPQPATVPQQIARALETTLTTTTNPDTIIYDFGQFSLTLPLPLPQSTSTDAIAQIEATENRFTQIYLETFPEIEAQKPLKFREIRRSLAQIFAQTGQNAAILYAWWDARGLRLGLVRRDRPPVVKLVKTNRQKVEIALDAFDSSINDITAFDSQELSQILIAPIAEELQGIDTLLTSFDEGLRNIAIAALVDGETFLLEKYNLTTIPSLALMKVSSHIKHEKILAMGVSEFGYDTLQFVPLELEKIAQYREGNFFLDKEVTPEKIKEYPAPIVHLATHASPQVIVFGDRIVTLAQFRELTQDRSIKLLVLSGCETGRDIPQNRLEMGFAGLAARSNTDSVLASRWRVNDGATAIFMGVFYQYLEEHPKSEALRLAQLDYKDKYPHYSHPRYWAAFGLVGSP